MPKSFEEARSAVVAEIDREEPDNGMHAMWIRSKKATALKMTEADMNNILNGPDADQFETKSAVAKDIQKKMQSAGGRRKTRRRKSTRRSKPRA
jgi:hypothetical protein